MKNSSPNQATGRLGSSFRDPSGFVFRQEGVLYRQVNRHYQAELDLLLASGLYDELTGKHLLVSHAEVTLPPPEPSLAYKVLRPEAAPFISYPYEWSFSQLKDAALATLRIQKLALGKGMSLKDASAYNIQFFGYRPVLIDTLSFEAYQEGEPWTAYRQFCQHFLAPLALAAYKDVRLSQLLRVYIDGIPLDLASELLPTRTRLNLGLATHLHLHAAAQRRYSDKTVSRSQAGGKMGKAALLGLIDSLQGVVKKLEWKPSGTAWADYYTDNNYTEAGLEHKRQVVGEFLQRIQAPLVWDLGANTGLFSRVACGQGAFTVAFDVDPGAVELNYREAKKAKEETLLPLVQDLTNPSAAIGWQNQERMSFGERGPAGAVLALALVHHLAIANNTPLGHLADFFASLAPWLVIEFVPKSDSQVQRLLATRKDIFPDYTPAGFEQAFARRFAIRDSVVVKDSQRCIYLMERCS